MPHRLPPLNALRTFEAAARHGSFARAAEELAVTPAAPSRPSSRIRPAGSSMSAPASPSNAAASPYGSSKASATATYYYRVIS